MTDHERYDTPEPGATDWHEPLDENFADLDAEVVSVVDEWDDLPDDPAAVEQSSSGQWPRYLVLEHAVLVRVTADDGDSVTREVVGGLGSADHPLPRLRTEDVRTETATVDESVEVAAEDPYSTYPHTLVLGTGGNENTLAFRGDPDTSHVGRMRFFRADGTKLGLFEFDEEDDEFSMYIGPADGSAGVKKLNISYGSPGYVRWGRIGRWNVGKACPAYADDEETEPNHLRAEFQKPGPDSDARIRFVDSRDEDSDSHYMLRLDDENSLVLTHDQYSDGRKQLLYHDGTDDGVLSASSGMSLDGEGLEDAGHAEYTPQDVRTIESPERGTVAFHDGSGTDNPEGMAQYTADGEWQSLLDGSTID